MTRGGLRHRPATLADLPACARILRRAMDDYGGPLGRPPLPEDQGPLLRLLAHLLATDPDRCWVAEEPDAGPAVPAGPLLPGVAALAGGGVLPAAAGLGGGSPSEPVAFAAAAVRGPWWFLATLFVLPGLQGAGAGTALLDRALAGSAEGPVPGPGAPAGDGVRAWGMATDAAQPVSNALYARRGMPARTPLWLLGGELRRPGALPAVPRGLEAVPFDEVEAAPGGAERLAGALASVDLAVLGAARPADHAFLRREGREGLLLRDRATGAALGWAYGSGAGRLGPVSAVDPALHPALLGAAVGALRVPAPVATWVPGAADAALRALLEAGLRIDGIPALLCWSAPDHPFDRHLPLSPALP